MIQQLLTGSSDIIVDTFIEGGFFAGYISQAGNGVATHGLVVAPAASGYNGKSTLQWKTSNTSTSGTSSLFDGAANTANMANSSHPAANYCAGLTINGYSDWYLPSLYELEIAYYNLKPTTDNNDTSYGNNPYAVPTRSALYTTGNPAQTSATAFQTGGGEDFVANYHWCSTEASPPSNVTGARLLLLTTGGRFFNNKTTSYYVRAFRKFAV